MREYVTQLLNDPNQKVLNPSLVLNSVLMAQTTLKHAGDLNSLLKLL